VDAGHIVVFSLYHFLEECEETGMYAIKNNLRKRWCWKMKKRVWSGDNLTYNSFLVYNRKQIQTSNQKYFVSSCRIL